MAIPYLHPDRWIKYDSALIARTLSEAASGMLALQTVPYRKEWVERLQEMELKREIAGTSQIEGADFAGPELEQALNAKSADELKTHSQRQAFAVKRAYDWIGKLSSNEPLSEDVILNIHRLVIRDADDDHCAPGQLRGDGQMVTFGAPRHAGVPGGDQCRKTFNEFVNAVRTEYPKHDPMIQAFAAHYHLAAMHPFLDGNGRTARVLEALVLQRAGLHSTCFVAMSNFYYDEKESYLDALAAVRSNAHDLTPFIVFGLKGVATQTRRLLDQIKFELQKTLFRDLMNDLVNKLRSKRRRVIAERQAKALELLLERGPMTPREFVVASEGFYKALKNPVKAFSRDLAGLMELGAIEVLRNSNDEWVAAVRLDWPSEMSDTSLFKAFRRLPKARTPQLFRLSE